MELNIFKYVCVGELNNKGSVAECTRSGMEDIWPRGGVQQNVIFAVKSFALRAASYSYYFHNIIW